jgi:hypothetical protein
VTRQNSTGKKTPKRHNKTATMGGDTATSTKKKKGLFSRFRKKNKGKSVKEEKPLEATPPPSPQPTQDEEPRQSKKPEKSFTKEGIPVITADNPDDFQASDVRKTTPGQPAVTKSKKAGKSKKRSPRPGSVVLDHAPTAREAAFGGPPRYDWIDVETAAAVKVQAAYRRNKAMDELQAQGVSTAAMRNRARRRKARHDMQVSEDTPSLFRCCGLGLAFGDGTEEDFEAARLAEKERYEEKKREKAEREAELRKYSHRYKNKKPGVQMVEAVEVVESDEED